MNKCPVPRSKLPNLPCVLLVFCQPPKGSCVPWNLNALTFSCSGVYLTNPDPWTKSQKAAVLVRLATLVNTTSTQFFFS